MLLWQVEVPDQVVQDLTSSMESAGIPVPDSQERWALALQALKVWPCFTPYHGLLPASQRANAY